MKILYQFTRNFREEFFLPFFRKIFSPPGRGWCLCLSETNKLLQRYKCVDHSGFLADHSQMSCKSEMIISLHFIVQMMAHITGTHWIRYLFSLSKFHRHESSSFDWGRFWTNNIVIFPIALLHCIFTNLPFCIWIQMQYIKKHCTFFFLSSTQVCAPVPRCSLVLA